MSKTVGLRITACICLQSPSVTTFGWFVFSWFSESFDSASDVLYILRLHYKLLILKDYFQYSVFNVQWVLGFTLEWA